MPEEGVSDAWAPTSAPMSANEPIGAGSHYPAVGSSLYNPHSQTSLVHAFISVLGALADSLSSCSTKDWERSSKLPVLGRPSHSKPNEL